MTKPIVGFSKISKEEKINWLSTTYLKGNPEAEKILKQYWNKDLKLQQLHDEFTENTVSNFYLPFGIAPNFLINGRLLALPMATEESSVIAAASKAAKFWLKRGGFKAEVFNTEKIGQVHFIYKGDKNRLNNFFNIIKPVLIDSIFPLEQNMKKRGGGLIDIELRDKTASLKDYYQLHATFQTVDSMGANFINSCLETFAEILKAGAQDFAEFSSEEKNIQVIMSILSNLAPNCLVRAEVSCPVEDLCGEKENISSEVFAEKFLTAVKIAEVEQHRAVTHNKGIMNGIDAVILATGNDFRAVEAGIHAYVAKEGSYTSISHASVENGIFKFWLEIPLALGTVGGLTSLHPIVKLALEMLQKPSAEELMKIVAVAGLAQNFAALRSLITTGIQEGHMKMHLTNILNQLEATKTEKAAATTYFKNEKVTHSAVVTYIQKLRAK